jgi:hypothetical protein
MEPAGVVGIFTPWNSSAGSIAIKVAPAIAAGCTVVIKPSEMSAMQTEVLMDAFHEAGLPPGVINVVTGLGEVVGTELTKSPDIQKIAFTGSTQIGKLVAKNSLDTMKRFTLELGGKSPNIILDDADLSTAIPMAINACYLNNGQACIAASRLIVPEDRLDEVKRLAKASVEKIKMGDPKDKDVTLGPLASTKQYKRVQEYIKSGVEEGAELVIGGEGHPQGLERGNFIKPTVFEKVTRDMSVSGLTATSRVYDRTTSATFTGTPVPMGMIGSDAVSISGTPLGSFADNGVGNNKPVTVSGLALGGADAGNYTLSVPIFNANITPAPLTVAGITAASKVYDGTTNATINTTNATLNGVLPGDAGNVTLVTTSATAVKTFQPYDRVKEVNPEARAAAKSLIAEAKKVQPRPKTLIFVNNRLEGNALETIAAMLEEESF